MKISQAEARRLRRRVAELEKAENDRRNRWSLDYPEGAHLGSVRRDSDWLTGRIDAARMLGHAVVVTQEENATIRFYALPLPRTKA